MRILIAGLLAGLAMYVWTSLAHVATPLGMTGVSTLPEESATVANLASAIGDKGGLYLFPMNMGGNASSATVAGGLLVYNPKSPATMTPHNLIVEFVTELAESLIAAWLLAQTALTAFAARALFVSVIGVVSAIATNVSYWNWYSFPLDYTLANMFIELVGFIAAGLVLAAMLKPKAAMAPG